MISYETHGTTNATRAAVEGSTLVREYLSWLMTLPRMNNHTDSRIPRSCCVVFLGMPPVGHEIIRRPNLT